MDIRDPFGEEGSICQPEDRELNLDSPPRNRPSYNAERTCSFQQELYNRVTNHQLILDFGHTPSSGRTQKILSMISPGNFINALSFPSSHSGISVHPVEVGLCISSSIGENGVSTALPFPLALFVEGSESREEYREDSESETGFLI